MHDYRLPIVDSALQHRRHAGPRHRRWLVPLHAGLAVWLLLAPLAAAAAPRAYLIDLEGAVGPVSADYIVRSLHQAAEEHAAVIVLRMDTPGGLDTSMREIVRAILSSPVPVVGYVAPSGARAASAGTFILYACQIAAMAPGTNVGAATPVSLFGGSSPSAPEPAKPETPGAHKPGQIRPPNAEMTKVTNDAVAYIRGLAKLNGRNADWAEQAVREAASLSYDEALKLNVIDLVADNLDQLLDKLNGRAVKVLGSTRILDLAGATIVRLEPGLGTRLLTTLTDPNVAYILLLIGALGLIFEFSHPGIFAPGVIGSISLLLGLLALSIIPVNLAGVGLTVLGIGLMAAEAFVPSFGALGIGGIVAFALGSMMTFDTPGYRLAWPVVAGATIFSAGLFLVVLAMLVRARRRPVASGDATLIGARARVITWSGEEGEVHALGERWHARAETPLSAGQTVRIVGRDGLTLRVEPG
jgi:membrane-bound serine protease (ClpP class)